MISLHRRHANSGVDRRTRHHRHDFYHCRRGGGCNRRPPLCDRHHTTHWAKGDEHPRVSLHFSALDPMSLYFGLHPRRWDRVSVRSVGSAGRRGRQVGDVGRSERSGIVHDDVLFESVFAVVESWPRPDASSSSVSEVRLHKLNAGKEGPDDPG